MNEYLSRKIRFLSFFAIVGVVFCHAYNYYNRFLQPTTVLYEGPNPGTMLQFMISNGLVRFGVPLFFAFSGYLFFLSYDGTCKGYINKVLKRLRTLLVPYVIWTLLAGGVLYAVYRFVGMERYSIVSEHIYALKTFGISKWFENSPAFQLWYIAHLLRLVVISPLIYVLVKKCKLVPVIFFGLLWLLEITIFINCEGLFFFTVGAYLAVHRKSIRGMEPICDSTCNVVRYKRNTWLFTMLWIVGCFSYSLLSGVFGNRAFVPLILWGLYKVNVITGLVSVWRLYDLNCGAWQEKKWIQTAVGSTMFVYVSHEPLLHLLTDVCLERMVFNGVHTLTYFGISAFVIVLCVVVGTGFKKVCPKGYGLLTGGR